MSERGRFGGVGLSEEQLEGIAGGVLPSSEKKVVYDSLVAYKASGYTLQEAINAFMRGHRKNGDVNDYIEYADEIWDSL